MKSLLIGAVLAAALSGVAAADHDDDGSFDLGHFRHGRFFIPGNLVVSRSVYDDQASNVAVGTVLPPNCAAGPGVAARRAGRRMTGLILPCGTTTPTTQVSALPRGSFSTK